PRCRAVAFEDLAGQVAWQLVEKVTSRGTLDLARWSRSTAPAVPQRYSSTSSPNGCCACPKTRNRPGKEPCRPVARLPGRHRPFVGRYPGGVRSPPPVPPGPIAQTRGAPTTIAPTRVAAPAPTRVAGP